ncbi:MAG: heme A synthase [Bryobacteraceae bacterium]|nr:heme A synthase [Bryobacteraceae bacterium]
MNTGSIALHRFALFTAVSTFLLIFLGGLVTSTGSGLSVPDWPTTYGENMFTYPIDKWVGGIKYEHGHRLFASFVGFLTVILAVWLGMKEERKWVRVLGYSALAAVSFQGLLGGLTVLFLLPTPISVAHGMLAQSFFCLVASIALITSPWWKRTTDGIAEATIQPLFRIAIVALLAVFLQLLFGAVLRHTYSGLSVPDFPLAYGQLFPSLSPESMAAYNQHLIDSGIKWKGDVPVQAYQIVVHMLHRTWAYVVAIIVFVLGYRMKRSTILPAKMASVGTILMSLITLQFLLGILTVLTRKEYIITSLHVVIGALVLVTCCVTLVAMLRLRWLAMPKGE